MKEHQSTFTDDRQMWNKGMEEETVMPSLEGVKHQEAWVSYVDDF